MLSERSHIDVLDSSSLAAKEPRWYLAYGSNMASSVFLRRRGIQPLEKCNVVVEGLELTFDLPAVPYLEPRMANCRLAALDDPDKKISDYDPQKEWTGKGRLLGVAYQVTAEDFAKIIKSEGGGASYQPLQVGAIPLDDRGYPTDRRLIVFALRTVRTRESYGQGSLRYLNLLRTGARENNLPSTFQSYLDSLPEFAISSARQRLGRFIFLTFWVPIFAPIMMYNVTFFGAGEDGNAPMWQQMLRQVVKALVWASYDYMFRPLFGEGERA